MKCPICDGTGGNYDYGGEWYDCRCCDGHGKVEREQLNNFREDMAQIDADIDRLMAEQ